jgi:hypothetical protein
MPRTSENMATNPVSDVREAVMTDLPAWHQALAYVLTGRRFEELGHQAVPDLDQVVAFLELRLGVDLDRRVLAQPHRPPANLTAGLGAAQLWAAVAELRRRLGDDEAVTVTRQRPLSAEERRLVQDVPPHYGT